MDQPGGPGLDSGPPTQRPEGGGPALGRGGLGAVVGPPSSALVSLGVTAQRKAEKPKAGTVPSSSPRGHQTWEPSGACILCAGLSGRELPAALGAWGQSRGAQQSEGPSAEARLSRGGGCQGQDRAAGRAGRGAGGRLVLRCRHLAPRQEQPAPHGAAADEHGRPARAAADARAGGEQSRPGSPIPGRPEPQKLASCSPAGLGPRRGRQG